MWEIGFLIMEIFTKQEDRWLREALHSVSSPQGLRERICHRLSQEVVAQTDPTVNSTTKMDSLVASTVASVAPLEHEGVGVSNTSKTPAMLPATRRQWLGWALALSLAALMFGVFQSTRPLSTEQLARHAMTQLDQILNDGADWHTEFDEQFSELAILHGQLRDTVRPVGYLDRSGAPIAEHCRVWKLLSTTTNKPLYVFSFPNALTVGKLTPQLQVVNRVSGGWSMVALRSGERIVVVLAEGSIESHFFLPKSA